MDLGGANAEGNNAIVNLARVAYNIENVTYPNEPHFRINAGIIQPMFTMVTRVPPLRPPSWSARMS